ncbi:MAG TPA: ribonuclease D [Mycobacteriales bacterium]|nr:ribonuclease D [Mycobacteriales bacterium]
MSEVVDGHSPPVPLLEPRGGVPPVIATRRELAEAIDRMAAGTGPVAVDAERASGFRYGQRAYLVQLRREDVGTILIDPMGVPDLAGLSAALADAEWVLHAASQDLPSLRETGLAPNRIFDTELGARLAGFERVGLATMVEVLLGRGLAKEHSAVDWSRRPLPEPWLRYAALDVEILVDLRDAVAEELTRQGKLEWAMEEFQAVLDAPGPAPRADPWRRTSGMHRVRSRRQLAVVRGLWEARDQIARQRDTAPGRVLPDSAIVAAATASPATVEGLSRLPGWGGRSTRRLAPELFPVVTAALNLPETELPRHSVPGDGPPPPSRWPDRDPIAAARLARARAALAGIAEAHNLPAENLLTPDVVRRLSWSPPEPADVDTVAAYLRHAGARSWQIDLTAGPLAEAMTATAAPDDDETLEADPDIDGS